MLPAIAQVFTTVKSRNFHVLRAHPCTSWRFFEPQNCTLSLSHEPKSLAQQTRAQTLLSEWRVLKNTPNEHGIKKSTKETVSEMPLGRIIKILAVRHRSPQNTNLLRRNAPAVRNVLHDPFAITIQRAN
jgi:hypothetical protein